MRRNFSGAFTARDLRHGAWVLTRPVPHEATIYLNGADFGAPLAFAAAPLLDLGVEWRAGAALLTLSAAHKVHSVDAINVIVHEPLPQLYDALPLPTYDLRSRRFLAALVFFGEAARRSRAAAGAFARQARCGLNRDMHHRPSPLLSISGCRAR